MDAAAVDESEGRLDGVAFDDVGVDGARVVERDVGVVAVVVVVVDVDDRGVVVDDGVALRDVDVDVDVGVERDVEVGVLVRRVEGNTAGDVVDDAIRPDAAVRGDARAVVVVGVAAAVRREELDDDMDAREAAAAVEREPAAAGDDVVALPVLTRATLRRAASGSSECLALDCVAIVC